MGSVNIVVIVLLALIVAVGVWVVANSRRKKWYKVYLANNEVMLLCRDLRERWWRTSDRYMRFKDEYGLEVTFPEGAHWVIKWVEVPEKQLDVARNEIMRLRQTKAENDGA